MALKLWFCAGRKDIWEPEDDIYWGSEKEMLGVNRYRKRDLEQPLEPTHGFNICKSTRSR